MNFCDQCGTRLGPTSRFCPGCGVSLAAVADAPSLRASTESPATSPISADVAIAWKSTEEDVDVEGYPFAEAQVSSSLRGLLWFGAMGAVGEAPPVTAWLSHRDEGMRRRSLHAQEVGQILGSFVEGSVPIGDPWDAWAVRTPLGHRGLVLVGEGDWSHTPGTGVRIITPVAYGINPVKSIRQQLRTSLEWALTKTETPYTSYVPLVDDPSQRASLMESVIAKAGRPVPGPLSDLLWLSDPEISPIGSNPAAFPGSPAMRVVILDESGHARQRPAFIDGILQMVEVPEGTVDAYVGWQLDFEGLSRVGFSLLGHRSLLAVIDAFAGLAALQGEIGGISTADWTPPPAPPPPPEVIRGSDDTRITMRAGAHRLDQLGIPPGLYRTTGEWTLLYSLDEDDIYLDDLNEQQFARVREAAPVQQFGLLLLDERAGLLIATTDVELIPAATVPVVPVLEDHLEGGTYLVGVDLPPGRYTIKMVSYPDYKVSPHLARLDDRMCPIEQIGSQWGNPIEIEIAPSDFAFSFEGVPVPDGA